MATVMEPRRALILYATMTKNTEKVATWFNETFNEYGWETNLIRIMPNTNWAELQDVSYFDDYDLVCLGSPIVGGSVLQPIIKALSFGGGGALEKTSRKKLDENADDAAMAAVKPNGAEWRRTLPPGARYGGLCGTRPCGIVFTTYGGFCGTVEPRPLAHIKAVPRPEPCGRHRPLLLRRQGDRPCRLSRGCKAQSKLYPRAPQRRP